MKAKYVLMHLKNL